MACAIEASSHALDQRRCDGLAIDVGVFTNLTGDHQDYHQTMDAYAAAKNRFGPDHHETRTVANKVAQFYIVAGKPEKAEAFRR